MPYKDPIVRRQKAREYTKKWSERKCKVDPDWFKRHRGNTTYARYRSLWDTWLKENTKFKGGCMMCGYNKCSMALDAHHVNPKLKRFEISSYRSKRFTPENQVLILEELENCIILCANCHREFHSRED